MDDQDRSGHGNDEKPRTARFVGALLIALGVIFLLQNSGLAITGNWWAVFIYLAAAANFLNMWRQWHSAGHFDSKASGSLVGGLLLTAVASIFMFGFAWDTWWPLILVAIGSGIVIGRIANWYTSGRAE